MKSVVGLVAEIKRVCQVPVPEPNAASSLTLSLSITG